QLTRRCRSARRRVGGWTHSPFVTRGFSLDAFKPGGGGVDESFASNRGSPISPRARKGTCKVKFAHAPASRRRDDEQVFTLIELIVALLIIAILIATAITPFRGARQRGQDRTAQSDLRKGLTAEKTVYTDAQTYSTDTTTAGLKGIESSLNWGGAISTK